MVELIGEVFNILSSVGFPQFGLLITFLLGFSILYTFSSKDKKSYWDKIKEMDKIVFSLILGISIYVYLKIVFFFPVCFLVDTLL